MKTAATSRPDQTGSVQRDSAGAAECRLQLLRLKHGAWFRRAATAHMSAHVYTHTNIQTHKHTAIQVAGQPLAGRAGEARRRTVDHGAGLAGLGLSAAAVAELGAQDQESAGRGGLDGRDPEERETERLHQTAREQICHSQ